MTWWLVGFVLSLVPFAFGLVFMWLFVDDSDATIKLFGDMEIQGPTGVVVFVIGAAGVGYCLSQLAGDDVTHDVAREPVGMVEQVEGIVPLTGTLTGEEKGERLTAWLKQYGETPVVVSLDGERDLQGGDQLVTLPDGERQAPRDLANLDTDAAAPMRVSNVFSATARAELEGFAADDVAAEAIDKLPTPVSADVAIARYAPVHQGRRVVRITKQETGAHDALNDAVGEVDARNLTERERELRNVNVINLADSFAISYPGSFFAAEVHIWKGDAQARLGRSAEALATYKRVHKRFRRSPKARRLNAQIAALSSPDLMASPVRSRIATGAGGAVVPRFVLAAANRTTQPAGDDGIVSAAQSRVVPLSAISVRASSTRRQEGRVGYRASNTLDRSPSTAWSEGEAEFGERESITFAFDDPYDVRRIRIVNGYAKSRALFKANSRPDRVRVTSRGRTVTVDLDDTLSPQVRSIVAGATRRVTITIDKVVKGTFRHTMLSEVEFLTGR